MLKLKARNFRQFQEPEPVIFLPGLTIVSGPNGAGKSTLVEALIYALFGAKRGQAGDIQPDSATGATGVECELIIDGQTVRVCRFNDRAELWINNALQVQDISTSSRVANTQLRRLLGGLTREQFEGTYVALQGDTAGLVEEKTKRDRDQRREIIESVLQLEVLRKAVENQERLRDRTLDEAKDKGKSCIDELGLDSQANARLSQFANARSPERRAEHAQRFLANVQSVVTDREVEVAQAAEAVKQAQDIVKYWEEARHACVSQIKTKTAMLKHYEELHTRYIERTNKISVCNGQIQSVKNDMQQLGRQITEAERHAEAAAEHARLTASIQQCQSRLSRLELVKLRHETLVQRQDDLHKIERDLQGYAMVDQQLQDVEGLATKAEAAWNGCQADPTAEALQEWQQRKADVDLQEKHIKEALRVLEDATQDLACPTCGHLFTTHSRKERIQHLHCELTKTLPNLCTELATAKAVLNQRQTEWEQAKQAASKAMQARQKDRQRVLLLVAKRDNLRQRHAEVTSELRKAQAASSQLGEAQPYNPDEATQLKAQVGVLEAQAKQTQEAANRYARLPQWHEQLAQKQHQLQELQQALTELTQQQATVGSDSAAHQSARAEHTAVMNKANNVEQKLTDANKELIARQSATERIREALGCSMQLRDRFAEAVKAFQREDRLFTFLSKFQEHFFTANVGRVVERAAQLLQHAVTDWSILGLHFDPDNLVYLDASHDPRSIARLSGGEKALVGLCLRIALAEQAQAITRTGKVRFLVLDEVLSSLDDERREAVQRIFEDVLHRGIFEHIIMITHLDAVKHGWRGATLEVHKIDSKTSKVIAGVSDPRDVGCAEPVEVE
jgi:DNA repair protein SbcC/Rad50